MVVPGATLALVEGRAVAAASPYSLSSWRALNQLSVRAAATGRAAVAMKVVTVTDLAPATSSKMAGDMFAVVFCVSSRMPSQIYTVTAASLGSFALFVEGVDATTSRVVINRRLPVTG